MPIYIYTYRGYTINESTEPPQDLAETGITGATVVIMQYGQRVMWENHPSKPLINVMRNSLATIDWMEDGCTNNNEMPEPEWNEPGYIGDGFTEEYNYR